MSKAALWSLEQKVSEQAKELVDAERLATIVLRRYGWHDIRNPCRLY